MTSPMETTSILWALAEEPKDPKPETYPDEGVLGCLGACVRSISSRSSCLACALQIRSRWWCLAIKIRWFFKVLGHLVGVYPAEKEGSYVHSIVRTLNPKP